MSHPDYIGRFAPSPTGLLHMGSLVAAVGSWLRARQQHGQWLVRMEDLDPPREMPDAAGEILRSLEAHGLEWDGQVVHQSQRHEAYEAALQTLVDSEQAYPCYCSRKQVAAEGGRGQFGLIYTGYCRLHNDRKGSKPPAWRVITDNTPVSFEDLRCGQYSQRLRSEIGDFVIKRADGFYAYQLAVVVDDAWQQITEVVRGEDLLDNTPRQIHLQRLLGLPTPKYLHLPLVCNDQGQKLSKQTFAQPLDKTQASSNLLMALRHLGIRLPEALQTAQVEEVLKQALLQIENTDWWTVR